MAGMAGFEPAVHWIKTRCLTTWPHPCISASLKTGAYYPDFEMLRNPFLKKI